MPLVDARGYQLVPDISGTIQQHQQHQSNLATQDQARQLRQFELQQAQSQASRAEQIRQLLGGVGQAQPQTEQQRMLAQQSAEFAGVSPQAAAEQPQVADLETIRRKAMALDPVEANKMLKAMGLDEPSRLADASRFAASIQNLPREIQDQRILERANKLRSEGRDPRDTLELIDMDDATRLQALAGVQMLDLSTKERFNVLSDLSPDAIKSASQQEFEALIAGMSAADQRRARRIKAGLDPRAVGSASQTITDKGTAAKVAETEGIIAEGKKYGEMTGSTRAKKIDEGFDRVAEIRQGIDNIDKAIQAIDDGAQSGPIISRFTPTVREQTKRLEQVRNLMALDVLNSATFGALSENELRIVQETAMPDLPPAELREWLVTRQNGMRKLEASIKEQIQFLDQGGTPAGYLRKKEREIAETAPAQPAPRGTPQPTTRPGKVGRFTVTVEQE